MHWGLIEADLHERYGIDVEQPGLLQARTWRWLSTRIVGLLSVESRLHFAVYPPEKPKTPRR